MVKGGKRHSSDNGSRSWLYPNSLRHLNLPKSRKGKGAQHWHEKIPAKIFDLKGQNAQQ